MNENTDILDSSHSPTNSNDIVESIALQEAELAHILSSEGEKLQGCLEQDLSLEKLCKNNSEVTKAVDEVTLQEIIMLQKLQTAVSGPFTSFGKNEKGTIKIRVTNLDTNEPIKGAKIEIRQIDNPLDVALSDNNGYCCKHLDYGTYNVKISYLGRTIIKTVTTDECNSIAEINESLICSVLPELSKKIICGCVMSSCGSPVSGAKILYDGKAIANSNQYGFYSFYSNYSAGCCIQAVCGKQYSAKRYININNFSKYRLNLIIS